MTEIKLSDWLYSQITLSGCWKVPVQELVRGSQIFMVESQLPSSQDWWLANICLWMFVGRGGGVGPRGSRNSKKKSCDLDSPELVVKSIIKQREPVLLKYASF